MFDALRERARSHFDGVAPSHDWHHVRRVERLVDTLAAESDRAVDERVLRAAVLLHDIGRGREDRGEIRDHAEWGAERAPRILADVGFPGADVRRVQHCIRAHRYSNAIEPETIEAKLLSDADNLDALGAVGIARTFSYGAEHANPMHDPALPPDEDAAPGGTTSFNHFHKKILHLPGRMYTDPGRALAEERVAFVDRFLDRFEREVDGER